MCSARRWPRPGHEPSLAVGENVRLGDGGRAYLVEIAGDGISAWLPIFPKMADGSLLQADDLLHSLKAAGVVTVIDLLQVSEDEMRAVLEVHPPDGQGRRLTGELLLKLLADHRITHGVRKETIRRAVDHAAVNRQVLRVVAAVGREPVDGDDAAIEVLVKAEKSAGRITQPTDSIDFRERDTISSVRKGEELARRTPPEPGIDGWTVRGMPLSAKPGSDIRFQPQPNVVITDDGLGLLSDIDGMVTVQADNKIAVFLRSMRSKGTWITGWATWIWPVP